MKSATLHARTIFVCLVALLLSASTERLAAQEFTFKDQAGEHLDVIRDGKPLIRYMYAFDTSTPELRHDTYKVYHHVFGVDGKQLITKGPGGRFTHHRGLFIGFSRTEHGGKTYDLWHMKNECSLVHQKVLKKVVEQDKAVLSTLIHWDIAPDETILEETRTLTIHTDAESHLLADWESTLKAVKGDVLLKSDPEHGGMQYRPSNEVAENKSAKYLFHQAGVDPKKDKDLPWVTLTCQVGDENYSVQHMRHTENPKDSVYSAYRDYGRFGNYFVKQVPDGESLTLKYRFRIATGEAEPRSNYARYHQAFVKNR